MVKIKHLSDCKPTLYGAIVLFFPHTDTTASLQTELSQYGDICIYEECIEVTYKEIKKLRAWEIDDMLTSLFEKCDLENLRNLSEKYSGKILIDISFTHGETYPALLFSGKNMETIRDLRADISIDPF